MKINYFYFKALLYGLLHKYEASHYKKALRFYPYRIGIELTNKCNLDCIHCIEKTGYEKGMMGFDKFKKVFNEFPYALSVSLNGVGEPLLHPQFFDIIRYIKHTRSYVITTIFSNGVLINESMARDIIKSGLSKIHISLDATNSSSHKKIRGTDKFDKVLNNIKTLVELKRKLHSKTPLIGINFILMKENEGELIEFIKLAKELGVDYICEIDSYLFNFGDWKLKGAKPLSFHKKELEEGKQELKKSGIKCMYYPELSKTYDWNKPFICDRFWKEIRVTFNGNVTPGCCIPFAEQYSYGNILESSFKQIWNSEKFIKDRELAREGTAPILICKECIEMTKKYLTL
ncbi:MAG: radical SAM protein [bacterium]